MSNLHKRKQQKISQKNINREKFVFVFGIPRTGTSLCTSLINQSVNFYLAYEHNNLLVASGIGPSFPNERNLLGAGYNGNKICIFPQTKDWYVKYCVNNRKIIMHEDPERSKEIKIIFTFRRPLDSVVSSFIRNSQKGKITIESCVRTYLHGLGIIRSLMEYFEDYHLFRFDMAFGNDSEARRLFEFLGEEYDPLFYKEFVSTDHYAYGNISRKNILTGKRAEHQNYLDEAKAIFEDYGVNPQKIRI